MMPGATAVSLICGAGGGAQQTAAGASFTAQQGGTSATAAPSLLRSSMPFEPAPPLPSASGAAPGLPPRRRRLVKDDQLITPREVFRG